MRKKPTISLPPDLQDWANSQAKARGLTDAGAYVEHLVQKDQKRDAAQKLIQVLEQALASGVHEVTDATWQETEGEVFPRKNLSGKTGSTSRLAKST